MNIIQDFIPASNGNRPGYALNPTYITIHETANTSAGANAAMHARYVKKTLLLQSVGILLLMMAKQSISTCH